MSSGATAPDPHATAPDGSPVAVFAQVPAEVDLGPVLRRLGTARAEGRKRVLDLGCGAGRLANALARAGHNVTGVDVSEAMLSYVDPAVTAVQAPIETLELPRRFDTVVLASHLVNDPDRAHRRALLASAARHLRPDGEVLIQHHDPTRRGHAMAGSSRVEGVALDLRIRSVRGAVVDGEVTYRIGSGSWTQPFRAEVLDDAALASVLAAVGLQPGERLDPTWLVAVPAVPKRVVR